MDKTRQRKENKVKIKPIMIVILMTIMFIFCNLITTVHAGELSSFFNESNSASLEGSEQFPVIGAPAPGIGFYQVVFPSDHKATYDTTFNGSLTIDYPDLVSPGETVVLTSDVGFSPRTSQTIFSSEVDYSVGFEMATPEGNITLADASNFEMLPFNPFAGTLTGSKSVINPAIGRVNPLNTVSTDASGYGGVAPVVPLGTLVEGYQMGKWSTVRGWDFGPQNLLDKLALVASLAGNPILSLFELELDVDYDISHNAILTTDLITAYYSYEGIPEASEAFALNAVSRLEPTIEIPDNIGLIDGDMFDVTLDQIVINSTFELEYIVDGHTSLQMKGCLPLLGCTDIGEPGGEERINNHIATWYGSAQYVIPIGETMTFEITDTKHIPEPSTMLLLGSGLIGLGAFRKKFRK